MNRRVLLNLFLLSCERKISIQFAVYIFFFSSTHSEKKENCFLFHFQSVEKAAMLVIAVGWLVCLVPIKNRRLCAHDSSESRIDQLSEELRNSIEKKKSLKCQNASRNKFYEEIVKRENKKIFIRIHFPRLWFQINRRISLRNIEACSRRSQAMLRACLTDGKSSAVSKRNFLLIEKHFLLSHCESMGVSIDFVREYCCRKILQLGAAASEESQWETLFSHQLSGYLEIARTLSVHRHRVVQKVVMLMAKSEFR